MRAPWDRDDDSYAAAGPASAAGQGDSGSRAVAKPQRVVYLDCFHRDRARVELSKEATDLLRNIRHFQRIQPKARAYAARGNDARQTGSHSD